MKPIKRWECTACGEEHDSEDEAASCRCHGVRAFYICPVCDDRFKKEDECRTCIASHDDTPPVGAIAAELESAGQQRLLP